MNVPVELECLIRCVKTLEKHTNEKFVIIVKKESTNRNIHYFNLRNPDPLFNKHWVNYKLNESIENVENSCA